MEPAVYRRSIHGVSFLNGLGPVCPVPWSFLQPLCLTMRIQDSCVNGPMIVFGVRSSSIRINVGEWRMRSPVSMSQSIRSPQPGAGRPFNTRTLFQMVKPPFTRVSEQPSTLSVKGAQWLNRYQTSTERAPYPFLSRMTASTPSELYD